MDILDDSNGVIVIDKPTVGALPPGHNSDDDGVVPWGSPPGTAPESLDDVDAVIICCEGNCAFFSLGSGGRTGLSLWKCFAYCDGSTPKLECKVYWWFGGVTWLQVSPSRPISIAKAIAYGEASTKSK